MEEPWLAMETVSTLHSLFDAEVCHMACEPSRPRKH